MSSFDYWHRENIDHECKVASIDLLVPYWIMELSVKQVNDVPEERKIEVEISN
jgi:hypothetical protein